jgi:hypothetical protein
MEYLEEFKRCKTYEEFELRHLGDLCCDLVEENERLKNEALEMSICIDEVIEILSRTYKENESEPSECEGEKS